MIPQTAEHWIEKLGLLPHPEGGFYRETYRSKEALPATALPKAFSGPRSISTSILFLLQSQDRSMFHRIQSDELWHYHAGSSLSIYVLTAHDLQIHRLGNDPDQGESLQVTIPANHWFGALVNVPDHYALAGCTVAPGFDFHDFEMGNRTELLRTFPHHRDIICNLTKNIE